MNDSWVALLGKRSYKWQWRWNCKKEEKKWAKYKGESKKEKKQARKQKEWERRNQRIELCFCPCLGCCLSCSGWIQLLCVAKTANRNSAGFRQSFWETKQKKASCYFRIYLIGGSPSTLGSSPSTLWLLSGFAGKGQPSTAHETPVPRGSAVWAVWEPPEAWPALLSGAGRMPVTLCWSALCLQSADPGHELSLLRAAGMSAQFPFPYLCTGMDCFCQMQLSTLGDFCACAYLSKRIKNNSSVSGTLPKQCPYLASCWGVNTFLMMESNFHQCF